MNCVKRFLIKRGIKRRIRAFKEIKALIRALLFPILDLLAKLILTSLSLFMKSAKKLI